MEILIFFLFFAASLVVAYQGQHRKCGTMAAFFVSLFFSPLVGMFVVLSSKRLDDVKHEQEVLAAIKSLQNEKSAQ